MSDASVDAARRLSFWENEISMIESCNAQLERPLQVRYLPHLPAQEAQEQEGGGEGDEEEDVEAEIDNEIVYIGARKQRVDTSSLAVGMVCAVMAPEEEPVPFYVGKVQEIESSKRIHVHWWTAKKATGIWQPGVTVRGRRVPICSRPAGKFPPSGDYIEVDTIIRYDFKTLPLKNSQSKFRISKTALKEITASLECTKQQREKAMTEECGEEEDGDCDIEALSEDER